MTEDWRSDQLAKDHEDFVAKQVEARRARDGQGVHVDTPGPHAFVPAGDREWDVEVS